MRNQGSVQNCIFTLRIRIQNSYLSQFFRIPDSKTAMQYGMSTFSYINLDNILRETCNKWKIWNATASDPTQSTFSFAKMFGGKELGR